MATLDEQFAERAARIEALVERFEASADPAVRAAAGELADSMLALHGAALARLLEVIRNSRDYGVMLLDRLAADEMVRSMLLLHGLHPTDLERRLREAIERVRPLLDGAGFELAAADVAGDRLRLRIRGADGSGKWMQVLRQSLEAALLEIAPDVSKIEIEEVSSSRSGAELLPIIHVR